MVIKSDERCTTYTVPIKFLTGFGLVLFCFILLIFFFFSFVDHYYFTIIQIWFHHAEHRIMRLTHVVLAGRKSVKIHMDAQSVSPTYICYIYFKWLFIRIFHKFLWANQQTYSLLLLLRFRFRTFRVIL